MITNAVPLGFEAPLPNPLSVIFSPSHMANMVPAERMIVLVMKKTPGGMAAGYAGRSRRFFIADARTRIYCGSRAKAP